mgnify:CR=1 FL=1
MKRYVPYRSGRVIVTDSEHSRIGQEGKVVSLVPSLDMATVLAVGVIFGDGPTEYFKKWQLREL